jgi:hypothetical protein
MSRESVPDLAAIKLHDMSLVRIAVEWKAGLCTADIRGAVIPDVPGAQLRWIGVTEVEIPRGFPWVHRFQSTKRRVRSMVDMK